MKFNIIKDFIFKIPHYLNIALKLHSNTPNKEIKKIWEIIAISGFPVVLLTLFSGEKILWVIPTLKIDLINVYGAWIFLVFVLVFSIICFDNKRAKEITLEYKNNNKS